MLVENEVQQRRIPTMPRRPPPTGKRKPKQNPLDRDKITYIDYKDIALLRKFISDRGKIRSRRVTGLSVQQQKQVARAIKNAREMALLPYTSASR
jgi:small subunit ribosomal protein S18